MKGNGTVVEHMLYHHRLYCHSRVKFIEKNYYIYSNARRLFYLNLVLKYDR